MGSNQGRQIAGSLRRARSSGLGNHIVGKELRGPPRIVKVRFANDDSLWNTRRPRSKQETDTRTKVSLERGRSGRHKTQPTTYVGQGRRLIWEELLSSPLKLYPINGATISGRINPSPATAGPSSLERPSLPLPAITVP